MAEFLAVSTTYRRNFVAGHWSSFFHSLAEAASRLGHGFRVVGHEKHASDDDPLVALRLHGEAWADQLHHFLEQSSRQIVLVYEGSLERLKVFSGLARRLPKHTFIVNLFEPEAPLDVPRDHRKPADDAFRRQLLADLRRELRDAPENLVCLADSERRAFIAQALEFPIVGVWPLHSILADLPPTDSTASDRLAVLLATQAPQIRNDPTAASQVDAILRQRSSSLAGLDFRFLGSLPTPPRRRRDVYRRLRALEGANDGFPATSQYASRLADASVVWLPTRLVYQTQSSGKALDALVMRRPLLVPSGTYGDLAQRRWVPGAPSYGSFEELLDLLTNLELVVEGWRAALNAHAASIRTEYSAASAIRRLAAFASKVT